MGRAKLLVSCLLLIPLSSEAVLGSVNSNISSSNVNDHPTDDDVPSKVIAKIGDDFTIRCSLPDYELKYFSWFFCQSDCRSSPTKCVNDLKWGMVVKVDDGVIKTLDPTKFNMDPNGSLILKDIQPNNDHNWVRCCHKERFVGQDHRSTIIRVAQEPVITSGNPKEYVVFENMPFVMFCEVRGYPPPWVAWIRKGQVLQNHTSGPNYLVRPLATTEEAGIYTCKAGNFAGVKSFNYQVTVRADCPPGESTASPHSLSTVERPTADSKLTAEAPSADTARKSDRERMCAGDGAAIGLGIIIVVVIVLVVTVWCVKRRRGKKLWRLAVQYHEDATSHDNAID